MSMYVKLDLDDFGVWVPKVGFLITQEPIELVDKCHKTKLPGIIGRNLTKFAYQVFVNKLGQKSFENLDCTNRCKSTVIFPSLVYSITTKQVEPSVLLDSSINLKKVKQFSINEDGLLGKVWVGNTSLPLRVSGISALTIPGRLGKNTKIPSGTPCLVNTAAINNLPQGISINHCLSHPKGNAVLVIVMNQNNHNVWIQWPLLAEEFFGVEHLT